MTSELERAIQESNAQMLLAWIHSTIADTSNRLAAEEAVLGALRAARSEGARVATEIVCVHIEELARTLRTLAPHMHTADWPASAAPGPKIEPPPTCPKCSAKVWGPIRTHRCGVHEWPPPPES